jgi:16S rRNA (guanine966-N2)-methyltransferase
MSGDHTSNRRAGIVRVIAGRWRRRTVPVLSRNGLRPTPDRVRETLFNWLAPYVRDARCLDLFAGTGALGLEALSRGAAHCTFVEEDPSVANHLRTQLRHLGVQDGTVVCKDALSLLAERPLIGAPVDIVFVDPPFHTECQLEVLALLANSGGLSTDALIYVESASEIPDSLGANWQRLRAKQAGQVRYHLFRHVPPESA